MSSSETSAAAFLTRGQNTESPAPFHTVITIVIPGLPAGISTIAEIIKRISIKDLQSTFAQFLSGLLKDDALVAAVGLL